MAIPRSWHRENYADSYNVGVTGTEATAITGQGVKVPSVVYSVTIVSHTAATRVLFHDASSTGDSDQKLALSVAATGSETALFPRGLIFEKGVVISATGGALGSLTLTLHHERGVS